jgi:hypothetical protein
MSAKPPSVLTKLASLHKLQNKKSNSTSSVFAAGTISDPKMTELVSSVSTMLHCQMVRDIDQPEKKKKMLPFFCEELYTNKVVREVPSVKLIYAFLKQVFEVGQFNSECCVISLVYINRLIGVTGVPLTQSNWKPGMSNPRKTDRNIFPLSLSVDCCNLVLDVKCCRCSFIGTAYFHMFIPLLLSSTLQLQ